MALKGLPSNDDSALFAALEKKETDTKRKAQFDSYTVRHQMYFIKKKKSF